MTDRLSQIRARAKLSVYPPEHARDDVEWLLDKSVRAMELLDSAVYWLNALQAPFDDDLPDHLKG